MTKSADVLDHYRQTKHVMVDIETLATTADAVILSIGAYAFDFIGGEHNQFSVFCDVDSQQNRRVNHDTLRWWSQQKNVKHSVGDNAISLEHSLQMLNKFVSDNAPDYMWSNGANFDLPIIRHAMEEYGITPSWKFWTERCFRTFTTLFDPQRKYRVDPTHGALRDAIDQTVWFNRILHEDKE